MKSFVASDAFISKTMLFPSEIKSVLLLEIALNELNQNLILNETLFSKIKTCLNEALTNAIVHGNKENTAKFVKLDMVLIHQKCLIFKITDEGEGFKPEQIEDPTELENLEKTGGRGVFIMRKLADFCIFNILGNELTLYFKF